MTAVEYLLEKWAIQGTLYSSDIAQSKEMEEEQIKNAFTNGDCNGTFETINAEQYYNTTFKLE